VIVPPRTVRIAPEHVRALRRLRGFATQMALADASGVDQTTISRMERLAGPYELGKVRKLAETLDVKDLRVLGVPEEDAAAVEAEDSLSARLARLLGLDGGVKSASRNRTTGQARKRPVVRNLAPGAA